MKKEYNKKADELRKTLLSGNIALIQETLTNLKADNHSDFEEELLHGIRYENAEEFVGYASWNFIPNAFFSLPDSEEQVPEVIGCLWYGLISIVGSSQCKTAKALRKTVKSLNLSGLNLPELPPEIGGFTDLTELTVNGCLQFAFFSEEDGIPYKSFPSELGNLKKLKFLDMGQNTGIMPPKEISELKELEVLHISGNRLTEFPKGICELKNLRNLILDNNLCTAIPKSIGNLTALTELNLCYNKLAELPPEIGKLKKLETLEIGGNPLTSLPEEMKNLSALKTLGLYDHCLTSFPSVLKNLKNLADIEPDFTPWVAEDTVAEVPDEMFATEISSDPRIKIISLEGAYPKAAAAWKNRIICSSEEQVFLWDADTLEELWSDDASGISLLSFSADGEFFICVSDNGFIRRYNVSKNHADAELVWETETENMPVSLSISQNSKFFAVCHQDMTGYIWLRKCSDGTLQKKFGNTDENGPYEGYGYKGLAFSADGKTIYAGDQDWSRVRRWVSKTGEPLPPLTEDGVQFCSIECSSDGSYLFTGTVETPGAVWNVKDDEKIMSFEDTMDIAQTVSAHPSESNIFGSATLNVISVWDIQSQEKIEDFSLPEHDSVKTLSFSEDNFLCALVSYQGYEEQKNGSSYIALAYLSG